MQKTCLLPCLYLVISLNQYGLVDTYFILLVIIQHCCICCSNCSSLDHWKLFTWLLRPFSIFFSLFYSLVLWKLFLTFWQALLVLLWLVVFVMLSAQCVIVTGYSSRFGLISAENSSPHLVILFSLQQIFHRSWANIILKLRKTQNEFSQTGKLLYSKGKPSTNLKATIAWEIFANVIYDRG